MSDKHLTESAWKTFASKQKLKGPELQKALAALEKCDETDFDRRLAVLDEIQSEAESLKKKEKGNDEVVDYLDEVLGEVGKASKKTQAEKKAAAGNEKEGEDDEESVDPAAIKKKMIALLGQVKKKEPDEPQLGFMACIGKGESAVLLAKKIGSTQKKMLLAMLPRVQGPKFFKGECHWEENTHTFVLEKVPGGLAKKLAKSLLNETGLKYKVRVRSFDGLTVSDSDTDPEQEIAESEGEPLETEEGAGTTAGEPAGADLEAQWKQIKQALYPDLKQTLDGGTPHRAEILRLVSEATQHEKAASFQAAIDAFQQLRPFLGSSPASTPPPPPSADDLAARYQQRLATITPGLQHALREQLGDTGKLRAVAGFAQEKAGAGNFQSALQALDALEKLLAAAGPASPEAGYSGLVAYRRALLAFSKARQTVSAQIEALRVAIPAQMPDEDEVAEELALELEELNEELSDAVDAAMNTAEQEKSPVTDAVRASLQRYLAEVNSNPLVQHADGNVFGVKVTIQQTLGAALADIIRNMPAAA